jgi:hypothetical protein
MTHQDGGKQSAIIDLTPPPPHFRFFRFAAFSESCFNRSFTIRLINS